MTGESTPMSTMVIAPAREALENTGAGQLVADLEPGPIMAKGGSGMIREARQPSLDRMVAIKNLLPDHRGRSAQYALLREAVIAGRLDHPHIVPVHALGTSDDAGPSIVMKRVIGSSWLARIQERPRHALGSLDALREDLRVLIAICRAVEYAHSRRVVHRDIKPANVLIGHYGEVYLIDWGLALLVDEDPIEFATNTAGTPAYLAPEIMDPTGRVTTATDIWLLGASLFHALEGHSPYGSGTIVEAMDKAARAVPLELGAHVSAELAAIIGRACAPHPEDRYGSVAELRRALAAHLEHLEAAELLRDVQADHAKLVEALKAGALRGEPAALRRRLEDARLGYEAVLRQWPQSQRAAAGRQTILQLVVRFELSEDNFAGAVAAFAELHSPPDELRRVYEAARERHMVRTEAPENLERARRREHLIGSDWRPSQLALATGVVAVIAGTVVGLYSRARGMPTDYTTMLIVAVGLGIVARLVLLALRDSTILQSARYRAYNAGFGALFWLCAFALIVGVTTDLPVRRMPIVLGILGTCVATILAVTVDRWLWSTAVCAIGASAALVAWPTWAPDIIGYGFLVNGLVLAWVLRPRKRAGPRAVARPG